MGPNPTTCGDPRSASTPPRAAHSTVRGLRRRAALGRDGTSAARAIEPPRPRPRALVLPQQQRTARYEAEGGPELVAAAPGPHRHEHHVERDEAPGVEAQQAALEAIDPDGQLAAVDWELERQVARERAQFGAPGGGVGARDAPLQLSDAQPA